MLTLTLSSSKCRQYHLKFWTPAGNEEEDPEEIEGVSKLYSEHEGLDPEAQNSDPSLGSESSVGNLDDF